MILLVAIMLIFASCAQTPDLTDFDSVDLAREGQDHLRIDERNTAVYGPDAKPEQMDIPEQSRIREPVVGLAHYSTMYHSQALIQSLRVMEEKSIKISVMTGYGFGGILAALYAKNKSVSYVEWKLFSLMKILKKNPIYSPGWLEKIRQFLNQEFQDKKANQLAILFAVPRYNKKGELILDYTDRIAKLLFSSLQMDQKGSFFTRPQPLKALMKNNLSADIVHTSAYLPERPQISQLADLEYGIQTMYLSKIMQEPDLFGLHSTPGRIAIDQLSQPSDIDFLYQDSEENQLEQLEQEINKWRADSTGALNYN